MLPLVLASASPRRREILEGLGIAVTVEPANVDERILPGETAAELAARLAAAKAAAVAAKLRERGLAAIVLGADTVVALEERILGKPASRNDALEMLQALSGRTHVVITACRIVRNDDGRTAAAAAATRVRFAPWDERRARWYVGTGEPMDKAGAYGIQGYGAFLSDGIEGSWSNVVGLPLELLPSLFREVGDDLLARMERPNRG